MKIKTIATASLFVFSLSCVMLLTILDVLGQAQIIDGGEDYSMVICADSTVWTCGLNSDGQLGNGTTGWSPVTAAVQVIGLSNVTDIDAGRFFSIGLRSDGTVWTWGDNWYGQLGDSTTTDRSTPVQVLGLSNITDISAGSRHAIALRNDGTVWTWGRNSFGELGIGTSDNLAHPAPVQVSGLSNIIAISGGGSHSIALKSDSTVWAWGSNSNGQLGDGTLTQRTTPVQVSGLSDIIAIAGGPSHSMAIRNDVTVWTWGGNLFGQLGDGTTTNSSTPIQVSGLSNIIAIASGPMGGHSMALQNDGTVWTWGYNGHGQLGDSTTINRSTPVQVSGLSNVTVIGAGGVFSMFLLSDSTVWASGWNFYGELADGTTIERETPVQMQLSCNVSTPPCFVSSSITPSATTICEGNTVNFTSASTGATSFEWQENGTTFSISANASRTFNTAGIYTISLIASDGSCADTSEVIITTNSLPAVSFSGLASTYCEDAAAVILTGSPTGGTFSGNGISGSQFDPAVAGVGTQAITYTYTDGNGCTDTSEVIITTNSLPAVSFSGLASTYCEDDAAVILTGSPTTRAPARQGW